MTKKSIYIITIISLIFISASIYPLFLIIQEAVLDSYLNSRYKIEEAIDIRNMRHQTANQYSYELAAPIQWKGNIIEVLTSDTGVAAPKSKFDNDILHVMQVSIKVNGKERSFPTQAWLPKNITKDSDYLSWLNLLKVKDNKNNIEQMAIVQRIADNWQKGDTTSQKWRVLYVDEDKQVTEELFSYLERGDHLLGLKLVLASSQSSSWIGYKSDIAYRLPSIFFPLLYPTGTFLIGLVLTLLAYLRYRKIKKAIPFNKK
ncbi:hypothetical protein [Paenibacillus elgii]|uniref:hypothetical protein n=1 Tax=Paenibacillus elgii TaxID=189691 RepID=UPI00203AA84E|nr:hypothetical protein [Paenibacillus elgii]MCM3271787.1 hypothetical protein [Paenibacillus elgii]